MLVKLRKHVLWLSFDLPAENVADLEQFGGGGDGVGLVIGMRGEGYLLYLPGMVVLRARPSLYFIGAFFGRIGWFDPILGKGLDEIGGGVDRRRLDDLIFLAETLGKRLHFVGKQVVIGSPLHYIFGAVLPLHFFHLKVYCNKPSKAMMNRHVRC